MIIIVTVLYYISHDEHIFFIPLGLFDLFCLFYLLGLFYSHIIDYHLSDGEAIVNLVDVTNTTNCYLNWFTRACMRWVN